jgi:hypothetical protein
VKLRGGAGFSAAGAGAPDFADPVALPDFAGAVADPDLAGAVGAGAAGLGAMGIAASGVGVGDATVGAGLGADEISSVERDLQPDWPTAAAAASRTTNR